MIMQNSFTRAAMVVGVLGCVAALAACGRPGATVMSPPRQAAVNATEGFSHQNDDPPPAFTNSVPETPWWQVAPAPAPSVPPGPVTDQWTLSGDVLFDSGSAT